MEESIIKKRLVELLKKDFQVIEDIKGKSFYNDKVVIPDLAFFVGDKLFIVEIKDDTTNNFSLLDLLRQTITYKFATYNGIKPVFCFITTTKMLKGQFNMIGNHSAFDLAYKLGIGRIYLASKKIQIGIGSQIFYRYYIQTKESEFNFEDLPSMVIGTKSKSNKLKK